jgi:hypothetical protein
METRLIISDALVREHPFRIWGWNWIENWFKTSDGTTYQVSQGIDILVASTALAILSLATDGRMTPQRIWRMAIKEGRFDNGYWRCFRDIDYHGKICDAGDLLPMVTPGYPPITWIDPDSEVVSKLEELGNSEVILQKIIWEGKYWVWMRPDRYAGRPAPIYPPLYSCNLQLSHRRRHTILSFDSSNSPRTAWIYPCSVENRTTPLRDVN